MVNQIPEKELLKPLPDLYDIKIKPLPDNLDPSPLSFKWMRQNPGIRVMFFTNLNGQDYYYEYELAEKTPIAPAKQKRLF